MAPPAVGDGHGGGPGQEEERAGDKRQDGAEDDNHDQAQGARTQDDAHDEAVSVISSLFFMI